MTDELALIHDLRILYGEKMVSLTYVLSRNVKLLLLLMWLSQIKYFRHLSVIDITPKDYKSNGFLKRLAEPGGMELDKNTHISKVLNWLKWRQQDRKYKHNVVTIKTRNKVGPISLFWKVESKLNKGDGLIIFSPIS